MKKHTDVELFDSMIYIYICMCLLLVKSINIKYYFCILTKSAKMDGMSIFKKSQTNPT